MSSCRLTAYQRNFDDDNSNISMMLVMLLGEDSASLSRNLWKQCDEGLRCYSVNGQTTDVARHGSDASSMSASTLLVQKRALLTVTDADRDGTSGHDDDDDGTSRQQ